MEVIAFEVQGSAAEPYKVTFARRSPNNLSAYCTCPAGQNGQYCKHRFAILNGLGAGIVSSNANQVSYVQTWLPGTDVEQALLKVHNLEKEAERVKNELSAAKKDVANAMRN